MTEQQLDAFIGKRFVEYKKSFGVEYTEAAEELISADVQFGANLLKPALLKALEALQFVKEREDFSFAECSVAEELWGKVTKAIKEIETMLGES